ncbi:Fic family protein [Bosea massiliensis]|uniref:Fic family protein n=1 Tax=Bosea massiliensis TaxID=151419 RepID=A0ABW0PEH1_9HYPH
MFARRRLQVRQAGSGGELGADGVQLAAAERAPSAIFRKLAVAFVLVGGVKVVISVFVVVFLEIHPFQDGNGRLSRVLTTLLLLRAGYARRETPGSSTSFAAPAHSLAWCLWLARDNPR